jgi:hypothetical protein
VFLQLENSLAAPLPVSFIMPFCPPSAKAIILAALNTSDSLFHPSRVDDLDYSPDTPMSYWYVSGAHHPLSTGEDGCFRLIVTISTTASAARRNVPCFERSGALHRVSTGCQATFTLILQLGPGNIVSKYGDLERSVNVSVLAS